MAVSTANAMLYSKRLFNSLRYLQKLGGRRRHFSLSVCHHQSSENADRTDTNGKSTYEDMHSMGRTERVYDIIIAGGGMVGAAMACTLASNPLFSDKSILMLEAAKQIKTNFAPNSQYSNRVSSITPGSKKMFENIGVWKHIEEMRYKPYSVIHVWDSCGAGSITFDVNEISPADHCKDLAYIIENQVILNALYKQIKTLGDLVEVEYGKAIKDISSPLNTPKADILSLKLSSGDILKTRLLVAADGANSSIRRKLDMPFMSTEYDQYGVVATLSLDKPSENTTAWQRFLPTGPVASLPLSETKSSLVWSTSPSHARELVKLPEERFVDAVNNAFWEESKREPIVDSSGQFIQDLLATIRPGILAQNRLLAPPVFSKVYKGSRASFPLGVSHATKYVKNRVALIGDAAHRVHPLAGQGVNLGFADAETLCRVIGHSVEGGEDIGNLPRLLEYETERQREVIPMIAAIDALKKLFSTDALPFVLARTLGLQATNAVLPIKKQIMSFAMR